MDNGEHPGSAKQDSPKDVPSLFKYIDSNAVAGFDNVGGIGTVKYHRQPTWAASSSYYSPDHSLAKATGTTALYNQADAHGGSISISMPTTPLGLKRAPVSGNDGQQPSNYISNPPMQSIVPNLNLPKPSQFRSQPIASGPAYAEAILKGGFPDSPVHNLVNPRMNRLKDKRFDSFKTWSGKLERQISQLRGKPQEPKPDIPVPPNPAVQTLPVDRYFDALEGPELETLRVSEELVLPEDKLWPFLLRFPISSFGICLGVSSQAILWKTIAESPSTNFLHVSMDVNLILWCISVALMVIVPVIYSLKVVFFFEAVRREYYHPIRVNFFFAPWIALLFLAIGLPPSLAKSLPPALWYVLMTPFLLLELKIYGQWMSGGQRRLSKVANPSNHLSIVGNFVGSLLGASMGLKEGPILFFAVGLAHYIVLFVTLYQRLPTNETLPKELHPVFFLFVAAPSVASMAWAKIQGSFDTGSKLSYFIALFLYFSLAVRVNFFRGFKFSLAWWAYTFPMTGAAIATIRYANVVKNPVTQTLSVILSSTSTLTVTALLVSTIIHAFVLRDLFPNDIAIAISQRRPRSIKKRFNLATATSDTKDLESSLRTTSSNTKELEASLQNAASKF